MFVYYSAEQAQEVRQLVLFPDEGTPAERPGTSGRKTFRGPDVFVVRGGVVERERKVWASWLEDDRLPDFILKVQSASTAEACTRTCSRAIA